jgi:hypothetical protein
MKRWLAVALTVALATGSAVARIDPANPGTPPQGGKDSWADHDVGNVVCTVSDIGVAGYMDFPDNTIGNGFMYPAWVRSLLFEASLLIGTDDGGLRVSDAMRDENQVPNRDFSVSGGGDLVISTPGGQADQQGFALYNDLGAPVPIGVEVEQHTYSWASDPTNDFVIFRYVVTNVGGGTVGNVYIGMFMDWDVATSAADNSDYDYGNDLGYATGAAGGVPYAGIASLSDRPPGGYASLSNANEVYPPHCTEDDKWSWISSGFGNTSNSNEDLSLVMSDGPFTLAPGASQVVGFALLGGDDLADLQANAQAAQGMWEIVPVELASFEAVPGAGSVLLTWATASERDTYGFNVFRSSSTAGGRFRINEEIIAGSGTSSTLRNYSFTDYDVAAGATYYYWLEEVSLTGETALYGPLSASVPAWPQVALLDQPSPNPVDRAATIRYGLRDEAPVSVALYDLSGKLVRTLVSGVVASGDHQISWDGTDWLGRPLAGGVYMCRLDTPGASASARVVVLR